jgi:hypothetical protein
LLAGLFIFIVASALLCVFVVKKLKLQLHLSGQIGIRKMKKPSLLRARMRLRSANAPLMMPNERRI